MMKIFALLSLLTSCLIPLQGYAQELTIKELQKTLKEYPIQARWKAADSGVTFTQGIKDDWQDEVRDLPVFQPQEKAKAGKLDWRNKDGKNWVTPIRDQGRCGSCVAFGTIGMVESRFNIAANSTFYNPDISEAYLFAKIGECDRGSTPFLGLYQFTSGIPDEACLRYTAGRVGADQEVSEACANSKDRLYKGVNYKVVNGIEAAKAALAQGPLLTVMMVYEDFIFYKSGVYKHVTGEKLGGHAITIVGYNDEEKAFIVKNSWGEGWGEQGFFRIAYDDKDSNLGTSNFSIDVVPFGHKIRVLSPDHLEPIFGVRNLVVKTLGSDRPNYEDLAYSLRVYPAGQEVLKGSWTIDTRNVEDGQYELGATISSGKPWYSLTSVVNSQQQISLEVVGDAGVDLTKPVTGKIILGVRTTYDKVSLTKVIVSITMRGNPAKVQTVTLIDPGQLAKFGWRTTNVPNGEYEIIAAGEIGVQKFVSTPILVTVKN